MLQFSFKFARYQSLKRLKLHTENNSRVFLLLTGSVTRIVNSSDVV